jgi:hypothetical protein
MQSPPRQAICAASLALFQSWFRATVGPNTQKRVAVPTPESDPSPAPFGSQGKPFEAQGKQGKGWGTRKSEPSRRS